MTTRAVLPLIALLAGVIVAGEPAPPWSEWNSLRFRARAAFFGGYVAFRLDRGENRRRLETESVAKFIGVTINRSRTETISDSASGRPLESSTRGKRRGRHYVFDDDGYTVRKLKPDGDDWSVSAERRFDFEGPRETGASLQDYYGLLVDLKRTGLRRVGDAVSVWVATSKGPREFRVSVADARSNRRKIRGSRLDVRELRLRFAPLGEDADEGFLDMEGETEVWVEARSLTPVEISGQVPGVPGRVRLVLVAID